MSVQGLSSRRKLQVQVSFLASRWNISLKVEIVTLKATAQFGTNLLQTKDHLFC